ncbi:RsmB/NOP family class I SAM-dependent RNA methyltransferase [Candidatus Gottesmanbacteria bacterium]|nr:RsmB/NOP family class I SAM-dependent RNA methyltransferase [Candidatus Gottesmanbacteria bacterium]
MTITWEQLPKPFLERLGKIIPTSQLASVRNSFSLSKPSTFRTNTLKISSADLVRKLTELSIGFEQIHWFPDAFILKGTTQRQLMETEFYKKGFLYIQSLSSMIPAFILNPQPNETICDLTAAPGSKTTQMAAFMGNTGKIVANDISRVRLYKLEALLKLMGVTNTQVTHMTGEVLWKKYPEYFDKTLVDVPCSLEGRFNTHDPKSYADWTSKKIKALVGKQRFLIRSAVSATKPGEVIVYSTCTLAPEENEGIIDWILKKEGDAVQIEPIELNVEHVQGLSSWEGKKYSPDLTKTIRILPSLLMEGFFIAKLRKTKSNLPQSMQQI